MAGQFAKDIRAKRLVLTHFGGAMVKEDNGLILEQIRAAISVFKGPVEAADDGKVFSVERKKLEND